MSIEVGVIKQVSEHKVLIVADAKQACQSCSAKKSCLMSADKLTREIWAESEIDLALNDRVEFKVNAQAVVVSSLLIYLLPLCFLLLGSLAGYYYHTYLFLPDELAAALLGIISFLFSFLIVKFISKILVKRKNFRPFVVKKL
jgi:sigma-E factor negative regulatory protein RseC